MSDSTKSARASDTSSTGQAAIEIRGLLKEYGNHKAVNNVSFSVKQGEILGFLGPNGAGKTTTMRMITGYLSPTKGAVYVNGRNVFDYPLWVKRQIGYLPETPPLYMEMTTHAYLDLVANLKGIPHRHIRDEIASVVARCGLEIVEHRLIQHLSKGFKQRVGIAQALLGSPALLVLDEPTSGLDPTQIREVRGLIKDLARDHTVILSTHILPEVQIVCDRVIIIHKGELVASDTIENLNKSTSEDARYRVLLGSPDKDAQQALQNYPGVKKVRQLEKHQSFELRMESPDPSLLKHLLDKQFDIAEFYSVSPTLEELFLRIVSGRDLSEEEDAETARQETAKEEQAAKAAKASKKAEEAVETEETEETEESEGLELDAKGYNFGEQDFEEVLDEADLDDDDAQAVLDLAIASNKGDKSLSRKELEAAASQLKEDRERAEKAIQDAIKALTGKGYDFSQQDFREVMEKYGINDPDALALVVSGFDDGDGSLSRQELEDAAKALKENKDNPKEDGGASTSAAKSTKKTAKKKRKK